MDKVLSARVDESVLSRISVLARELHTTKKQVIEGAINLYAEKVK
ncbi:MAG: ribbon-helix-helix protein, CopG family [Thermodesulfobacteriota bacterium]|nr:ribbon-helix-helix protein, CopG family [Thermodesulfobacteriota bacterium]